MEGVRWEKAFLPAIGVGRHSESNRPVHPEAPIRPLPTGQEGPTKGEGQERVSSLESIQEALMRMNEAVRAMDYSLQFVPDQEADRVIVKVLDGEGRLIRQIPPNEILRLSKHLREMKGLLLGDREG